MTKARILADYVAGGTTAAEFDYMDGVTSNVQTQMDAKLATATATSTYAPKASPAFTGTPTGITAAHITSGVLPVGVTGGLGLSLVNRPCFAAEGDGTLTSMTGGTEALINFPTVYDPDSYYSTGTDRFTPTNGVAKNYFVSAIGGVDTGGDHDRLELSIRKNNTTVARVMMVNRDQQNQCISVIILLDGVDDYIDCWIRHGYGTAVKNNLGSTYQSKFSAFAIAG